MTYLFFLFVLLSASSFTLVHSKIGLRQSISKNVKSILKMSEEVESPTNIRARYDPNRATPVDSMNSIDQTWEQLEYFGDVLVNYSKTSLFCRAFAAGMFVGFGGILTSSVGFDMGVAPWEKGNGFARFLSGAIGFPLSILLVSMTGCGAWTGDMLLVARAYFSKSKKTNLGGALRMALITWAGCFCGTVLMALLATGAALPACSATVAIAEHKLSFNFLQTFIRSGLGGCMICLAIFMSKLNRDMIGKTIAIWFPISTYVICDFEHVLASMFFLTCVPSTLGNLCGGGLLIGGALFAIPKTLKMSVQELTLKRNSKR